MKSLLKTLAFIPLCLHLLFLFVIIPNTVSGIVWSVHIPIAILLLVIGIGIGSQKKIIHLIGNAALIILTAILCIMGYYDYLQWFSTIVGVVIFIYFVIIELIIKKQKIVYE